MDFKNIFGGKTMNWLEVKNSVNEWIWDNVSRLYLKVLSTDEETKMIKAQVSCGLQNELLYENGRFYKYEQRT